MNTFRITSLLVCQGKQPFQYRDTFLLRVWVWSDDFIDIRIYGGQQTNAQSLYYFNHHTSFWSCISNLQIMRKMNIKTRLNTERVRYERTTITTKELHWNDTNFTKVTASFPSKCFLPSLLSSPNILSLYDLTQCFSLLPQAPGVDCGPLLR